MASGVTVGSHERRDCLAASRAVACHFACDFAARSPFQTATEREAAHGTIRSTPTSVSTSTASSPRSPLGSAWTTVIAGSGRSARVDRLDGDGEDPLAGRRDRAGDRGAEAVGQHDLLALAQTAYGDGVVRLVARHLDDRARARRRPATRRGGPAGTWLSPGRRRGAGRTSTRGRRRVLAVGRLLATDRGQLAQQLLLARVEPRRGVDGDADDQVAATAAQARHAEAADHLLAARLGAGADVEVVRRDRSRLGVLATARGRPRAAAASAACRARRPSSAARPWCGGRCRGG